MKHYKFLTLFSLFICSASSPLLVASDKPNIILIFTDDMGYADLGVQGQVDDIRTPHLDKLAKEGIRFTSGYITSPQCVPSRAGIISGQYNTTIGVDGNGYGPLPFEIETLPEHLQKAGYRTGHVGKWHLSPNRNTKEWNQANPDKDPSEYGPQNHGFQDVFDGAMIGIKRNFELDGSSVNFGPKVYKGSYRLDLQSDAALAFLDRVKDEPFFLYLAYYAPHVPLQAPPKYLDRFPGEMPTRRRYALAMISAMDDGVGRIMQKLNDMGVDENTLVFFISDNGAPIKKTKKDELPVTKPGWDGSLNDPWTGEKGTLLEGGIRIPYIARWPKGIPAGQVSDVPVISLDVAATAAEISGIGQVEEFQGRSLVKLFKGKDNELLERPLFWRFWKQAAIRKEQWKYLALSDGQEWLFDLSQEKPESKNLISENSDKAKAMRAELESWANKQKRPGLHEGETKKGAISTYEFYLKQ